MNSQLAATPQTPKKNWGAASAPGVIDTSQLGWLVPDGPSQRAPYLMRDVIELSKPPLRDPVLASNTHRSCFVVAMKPSIVIIGAVALCALVCYQCTRAQAMQYSVTLPSHFPSELGFWT